MNEPPYVALFWKMTTEPHNATKLIKQKVNQNDAAYIPYTQQHYFA